MAECRVSYPCQEATLKGRLCEPWAVLTGVTDIFPFVDAMPATEAGIAVSAEPVLSLLRSVRITGGTVLTGSAAPASRKAVEASAGLTLSGFLDATLHVTLEGCGSVILSPQFDFASRTEAGPLPATVCVYGGAEVSLVMWLGVTASMQMTGALELCAETYLEPVSSAALITASPWLTLARPAAGDSAVLFAAGAEASAYVNPGAIHSEFSVLGSLEANARLSLQMPAFLRLSGEIRALYLPKSVEALPGQMTVSGAAEALVQSGTGSLTGGIGIGGELEIQLVRLRTLGDLAEVTLADVSPWTLYEFYYKEG